jgi:hypothetical protein
MVITLEWLLAIGSCPEAVISPKRVDTRKIMRGPAIRRVKVLLTIQQCKVCDQDVLLSQDFYVV